MLGAGSTPIRPGATADLDRIAARFHAVGGQPGLAYGVVADGGLVHAAGLGERRRSGPPPDADTVFRIASMTKSFTAALVLLLRDEGALRLDDPVVVHLPELAGVRGPTADAPPVSIRHLLTMSAGLPTDDPWGDRQQALPEGDFGALLRGGLTFARTPGVGYEYSNLGFAVLGRLAAAVGGAPYRSLVIRRLLTPLGMAATGFEAGEVPVEHLAEGYQRRDGQWQPVPLDGHGAFAPMGGLFSSVRDLAGWVAGLAGAFPPRDGPDGDHPLSRASRREMQQAHRAIPPRPGFGSVDLPPALGVAGYGFGLVVELDPRWGTVVSHSGGYPGFGSHMRWHPDSGLGVVVLGNGTYAPAYLLATRLLECLLTSAFTSVLTAPDQRAGGSRPAQADASARGPVEPLWPATLAARGDVERLLECWDDDLAARTFASNVDLDQPLASRREEIERVRLRLGPLVPEAGIDRSDSSAHCAWWMRGEHGRLGVEIRLTPEVPPRVQTLTLTCVPDPSPTLRALAEAVAAALGAPSPAWPPDLAGPEGTDAAELTRLVRSAASWAGPCAAGEAVAGDGERETTVRLAGQRAGLLLGIGVDDAGRLTRVRLQPDAEHLPLPPAP